MIEKNKIDSNKLSSVDKFEQSDYFLENNATTSDKVDKSIINQSNSQNNTETYDAVENNEFSKNSLRLVFSQECWIEIRDVNGNIVNSSVNPPDSELSFESSLPLSFIFGNAEGVELYISGVIFDHKPFTKVSVARFTIPNDE